MNNKYYSWQKTLSYDAPVTMVITARGYGKTYGLRKQCVSDWIKNKWRFVEITRHAQELAPLTENYYDRLQREYPGYVFKCEKNQAYIAPRPNEGGKPQWELLGYFVAMTQFQLIKKLTFNRVKRIFMDEAVLEKDDKNHRYLKNEWDILTNIVDTVTRERADTGNEPRLYLLGNACDILNPYFEHAAITGNPKRGYSWHLDKTFLLHNLENAEYAREKKQTLAGRMASGRLEKIALGNDFSTETDMELVADKTSNAEHLCTLMYDNIPLAIWLDMQDGYYYVNRKPPRDMRDTYTLTLDDRPNYVMIKRTSPLCQTLFDAYRLRYVRFDSLKTYGDFRDMLRYCGYR